jgi:hypothetical protein
MTDDLRIWLPPMLTLLGTLIVVVFTAWLNTRAVLAQVEKGMAELRLELKTEIAQLRLEMRTEFGELKARVKALEERAGVIYRP